MTRTDPDAVRPSAWRPRTRHRSAPAQPNPDTTPHPTTGKTAAQLLADLSRIQEALATMLTTTT